MFVIADDDDDDDDDDEECREERKPSSQLYGEGKEKKRKRGGITFESVHAALSLRLSLRYARKRLRSDASRFCSRISGLRDVVLLVFATRCCDWKKCSTTTLRCPA
jgi:hypothetical protein